MTFLSLWYKKDMNTLGIKVFMVSALALLWLWVIATPISSAQNFTQNQTQVGIDVPGGTWLQWDNLLNVIRSFINRVLGILWLIALIILLYGWFNMVTAAGNEEKYNEWFKILKQAGIGLAFIWLARFVVSIIFFLLGLITQ